jgi:hypothetical protein
MHPANKRLNEMNRLGDMLHFPAIVNAGATLNVLLTILAPGGSPPAIPTSPASGSPWSWPAISPPSCSSAQHSNPPPSTPNSDA